MKNWLLFLTLSACMGLSGTLVLAQQEAPKAEEKSPEQLMKEAEEAKKKADAIDEIKKDPAEATYNLQQGLEGVKPALLKGDSAWMMVSTAFVMLMVPGLALFYGGMVRRKNILATMMHSMVCLSVVGVFWFAVGYSLAFGKPWIKSPFGEGSILGWSPELFFMQGIKPTDLLPGYNIPVYLHMLYQGMFAIITPALISGALAERIKFKPYLIFIVLWATIVYCPLAHSVWAFNFFPLDAADAGKNATGVLGVYGALDFAGGTVVHIAAGFSSLVAILLLRKRLGYPEHAIHPSSMVLTLTGAGFLWFGWFGFNGGSGLGSSELGVSAFAATQMAAAAAGLTWMFAEWMHKGKPTALGLASGIVAGLVAVTPAAGFVLPWGGFAIGLIAGVVCYVAVVLKGSFGYDDSLDAFGVHGVGGFLGAVLTGVFCYASVQSASKDGLIAGGAGQVWIQFVAAAISAVISIIITGVMIKIIDGAIGFTTDDASEVTGLDQTEHGETGFDFGLAGETMVLGSEPRSAIVPPTGKRFSIVLDGVNNGELIESWSELCQPGKNIPAEFKTVYPHVTTVQGNRFQFRDGDQTVMKDALQKLFQGRLKSNVKARIE